MMTYLLLNIVVTVVVCGALFFFAKPRYDRTTFYTLLVVLLLTAVFDSFIIALGIVDYNYAKTIGIRVGRAPVEDFMYALVAVVGTIALWRKYDKS